MPNVTIQIKNLPEIKRAFAAAPAKTVKALNESISRSLFQIQRGEVEQYHALGIRQITNGLMDSIIYGTYLGNLRGEVGPNVTGSPGVDYSLFVHSGTRYMKARPFLLNAVKSNEEKVQGFFTDGMQKVLDEIAKEAS